MTWQIGWCIGVGGVALVTGVVDLWLVWHHGQEASLSAVIREASHRWPIIPFLAGLLAGHLFFAS